MPEARSQGQPGLGVEGAGRWQRLYREAWCRVAGNRIRALCGRCWAGVE